MSSWLPGCPAVHFWPRHRIPAQSEPFNRLFSVDLEIQRILPKLTLQLSGYMLELLRTADGSTTLRALIARISHPATIQELLYALRFFHHACILRLLPPPSLIPGGTDSVGPTPAAKPPPSPISCARSTPAKIPLSPSSPSTTLPLVNDPGRRHPIHLPLRGRAGDPVILFVTVCSRSRQPLLANESLHHLLRQAWADSTRWIVGRYVLLPDHLHFFCAPAPDNQTALESWIRFWKSTVTRQWHLLLGTNAFLWDRHFWDRQLRSGESYNQKWDYVRNNPVRHGHCSRPDLWPHQGQIHDLLW